MYGGGAAVASNAMPNPGGVSASPIPQQWWDQDAAQSGAGPSPQTAPAPTPMPPPIGNGGSAMDAAAANISRGYYRPGMRSPSPNIQRRFDGMNMKQQHGGAISGLDPGHGMSPGLGTGQGQGQGPGVGMGGNMSPERPGAGGLALGGRAPRYDGFDAPILGDNNPNVLKEAGGQVSPPKPKVNANGLIRLTLQKPMGIVFEPMADPHNPSQQRGVRICELPRTGAAALSGQLEIGDELLSINNKTMSRLTFDEIMDFIIEADAENVHLLFRRPKDKVIQSPDVGAQTKRDTVKWLDGNNGSANESNTLVEQKSTESDMSNNNHKKRPGHGREKERSARSEASSRNTIDEESILSGGEDTYNTYETEETRRRRRRNRDRDRDRGGSRRNKRDESFLDMLIDSICAPMMGEPGRKRDDDYSDDDMTFNSGDDDTYLTYDSSSYVEVKNKRGLRKKNHHSPSPPRRNKPKPRHRHDPRENSSQEEEDNDDTVPPFNKKKPIHQPPPPQRPASPPPPMKIPSVEDDVINIVNNKIALDRVQEEDPSSESRSMQRSYKSTLKQSESKSNSGESPSHGQSSPPSEKDTPGNGSTTSKVPSMQDTKKFAPQSRFEPQITPQVDPDSYEQEANIPISELEYDHRIDHGADVSVMESLGGPSLLIENMRAPAPATTPVSAAIINRFGFDFRAELGLTREETIKLDPDKFYRHIVKGMLQDNEPEKVRLLDKLFAKYSGREEHLILKLNARYEEKKEANEEESVKSNKENSMSASNDNGAIAGNSASNGNSASHISNSHISTSHDNSNNASGSNENTISREKSSSRGNSNSTSKENDDGFQQFEGFPKTKKNSDDSNSKFNQSNGWPDSRSNANSSIKDEETNDRMDYNSVNDGRSQLSKSSGSETEYDSIDGSSPAVIAQVSELLNYVYGKTSVPGQIDRVSTIMRAYEGREVVLLELLETKALLKANADESTDNLPEYLRRNPGLQNQHDEEQDQVDPGDPDLELPQDELSSDDDRSSGSDFRQAVISESTSGSVQMTSVYDQHPANLHTPLKSNSVEMRMTSTERKKKKKGIFGRVFKKNKKNSKNKDSGGAFPSSDGIEGKKSRSLMSPRGGKKGVLLRKDESDGSI